MSSNGGHCPVRCQDHAEEKQALWHVGRLDSEKSRGRLHAQWTSSEARVHPVAP